MITNNSTPFSHKKLYAGKSGACALSQMRGVGIASAIGRRLSSPGVPDAGEVDAVMMVGRTGEVDLTQ